MALLWASQRGDAAMIAQLIEKGVDIDITNVGSYTSLHWAATNGNATIVRMLIDAGANVNKANNYGITPLHFARSGDIAEQLVRAGADINALDINGEVPLHTACSNGRFDVVRCLLRLDAKAHLKNNGGRLPRQVCIFDLPDDLVELFKKRENEVGKSVKAAKK